MKGKLNHSCDVLLSEAGFACPGMDSRSAPCMAFFRIEDSNAAVSAIAEAIGDAGGWSAG